jgi:hypothetical protein
VARTENHQADVFRDFKTVETIACLELEWCACAILHGRQTPGTKSDLQLIAANGIAKRLMIGRGFFFFSC